jgi:hypothetical protein
MSDRDLLIALTLAVIAGGHPPGDAIHQAVAAMKYLKLTLKDLGL